jgi:hypothetical protein
MMDDKSLVASFDNIEEQVREPARKYTKAAIKTLAEIMKDKSNPPNVRRTASLDLLNQGWGRPDAREDSAGQKTAVGMTINILQLSDGSQKTIGVGIAEAKRIAAEVDGQLLEIPQNAERRTETE